MSLDILEKTIKKIPLKEEYFLFVVHVTKTIEPYLKEWVTSCNTIGIISIPYSENKDVKRRLSEITNIYEVSNYQKIPNLIKSICDENIKKKIILIEIGGYSAEVSKYLKNVILSVEDTNQGYWRFKKKQAYLTYPVVSIAKTELKKLENKLVGQSVVFSVERMLRDCFHQSCLTDKNVLVLSYGQIGKAVCDALRGRFSKVYVYDVSALRMIEAYLDGFHIVDKKSILPYIDIVIGASGHRSISMDDLPFLADKAILVSGSSRQVEFPYEYLDIYKTEKEFKGVYPIGNNIEEFEAVRGKTFFVVYKGQPINFIDDSAFGDTFEIILSGMAQCVRYALGEKLNNDVYDLPEQYQEEISESYATKKIPHTPREHFEMHKAATAFLLNWDSRLSKWKLLLVDHKKIGKLIPVGGHVEQNETTEKAVLREVLEEVNSSIIFFWDNQKMRWVKKPVLFSIQIEKIPAFKETPTHFHEDYMYVGYLTPASMKKIKVEKNALSQLYIDDILNNPADYRIFPEMLKTLKKLRNIFPPKIDK